jgi:hypothetical protein
MPEQERIFDLAGAGLMAAGIVGELDMGDAREMLCTWVNPCCCNCSRNSALSKSWGNKYSTPLHPAAWAAAKPSTNGNSANSIVVSSIALSRAQRLR